MVLFWGERGKDHTTRSSNGTIKGEKGEKWYHFQT